MPDNFSAFWAALTQESSIMGNFAQCMWDIYRINAKQWPPILVDKPDLMLRGWQYAAVNLA